MISLSKKQDPTQRRTHNIYSNEMLLSHKLNEAFPLLYDVGSTRKLIRSDIYQGLEAQIRQVTNGVEYGFYNEDRLPKAKDFYRAVFWNLSGQLRYEGLVTLLKKHPLLNRADVFCFAHSDIGMARSENRNLIRSLALERSFNYVTLCSFLHLKTLPEGLPRQNLLGIEGISIMTKYPLAHFRAIPLRNTYDPMTGLDRKIGCEKALVVDMTLHNHKLTFVGGQLDRFSSPGQRAMQLGSILSQFQDEERNKPILFAGDLQTSTYNTKSNWGLLGSIVNRVLRGYDYIAEEHHLHPDVFFEKKLFDTFEKYGFRYEDFNEDGKASAQKELVELFQSGRWHTKALQGFARVLQKLFFKEHAQASLRPDWFAANEHVDVCQQHHSERARTVENYSLNDSQIITHTPLLLDFVIK